MKYGNIAVKLHVIIRLLKSVCSGIDSKIFYYLWFWTQQKGPYVRSLTVLITGVSIFRVSTIVGLTHLY